MAPLPHDSASRLEAGQSKGFGEKPSSEHVHGNSSLDRGRTDSNGAPTERMPSAGRLLVVLLLTFLVTFGLANALSPRDWHRRPYQRGDVVREQLEGKGEEGVSFTSLLEAASPNSLHELLHKYFPDRFKDGVWESDVSAVEAVRRVDAALAASIVQLARRADNGTTAAPTTTTPPPPDSTSTNSPPTTTPPPDGETSTGTSTTAPPPTTESTSNPPGQTSTSTTTAPPTSSRTTTTGRSTTSSGTSTSADTTKLSSSSPTTSSTTQTSGFVTASHSGPLSTSISRGGPSNPTTGKPTFTSPTPSPRPVTSTFTSTMDNGGVVVVTTTSFVNPEPVATGQTSAKPSPTLQNAAPARRFSHTQGSLGAVVVAGVVLLI